MTEEQTNVPDEKSATISLEQFSQKHPNVQIIKPAVSIGTNFGNEGASSTVSRPMNRHLEQNLILPVLPSKHSAALFQSSKTYSSVPITFSKLPQAKTITTYLTPCPEQRPVQTVRPSPARLNDIRMKINSPVTAGGGSKFGINSRSDIMMKNVNQCFSPEKGRQLIVTNVTSMADKGKQSVVGNKPVKASEYASRVSNFVNNESERSNQTKRKMSCPNVEQKNTANDDHPILSQIKRASNNQPVMIVANAGSTTAVNAPCITVSTVSTSQKNAATEESKQPKSANRGRENPFFKLNSQNVTLEIVPNQTLLGGVKTSSNNESATKSALSDENLVSSTSSANDKKGDAIGVTDLSYEQEENEPNSGNESDSYSTSSCSSGSYSSGYSISSSEMINSLAKIRSPRADDSGDSSSSNNCVRSSVIHTASKNGQICSVDRDLQRGDNSQNNFSGRIESLDEEEQEIEIGENELECYVLSSGEESDHCDDKSSIPSTSQQLAVRLVDKEPIITKTHPGSNRRYTGIEEDITDIKEDEALFSDQSDEDVSTSFVVRCRSVRIGSYRAIPIDEVFISKDRIKIVVPSIADEYINNIVMIPQNAVVKVLAHFGRSLPVLFFYLVPDYGEVVRHMLQMDEHTDCYYDPTSTDERQKRITLLPEKFSDEMQQIMKEIYRDRPDALDYLNLNEANEVLVKSSPSLTSSQGSKHSLSRSKPPIQTRHGDNPPRGIMVYPPPPEKGGISINTEDYACLEEDVFLNDVIIDFYLKYISYKYFPDEEDRSKIHIFSSFFYKRLTNKFSPPSRRCKPADVKNPADVRHSRVMNWTKNIDIFEKDFIIIPINENSHWFLAVICFPGLEGPVKMSDGTPLPLMSSKVRSKNQSGEKGQGTTTVKQYMVDDDDDDENEAEERDEADGEDEEVDYYDSSPDDEADDPADGEPIKQPCILVFDSLPGGSRARIIATLREYLAVEYKVKHGVERSFSKDIVKGDCPKVPQQNNFTDCGLFLLEYAETLLREGIPDYRVPMKCLKHWFNPVIVSIKRWSIQQLIHRLVKEQGINIESLNLPHLRLRSQCEDSDEVGDYYDSDYEEHDMKEYNSDMEEEYYKEDEGAENGMYEEVENMEEVVQSDEYQNPAHADEDNNITDSSEALNSSDDDEIVELKRFANENDNSKDISLVEQHPEHDKNEYDNTERSEGHESEYEYDSMVQVHCFDENGAPVPCDSESDENMHSDKRFKSE